MMSSLLDILSLQRTIEIVDIGANPIDSPSPYLSLLNVKGVCRVTGFEPQRDALEKLNAQKTMQERYFPYVLGDGSKKDLHICAASGMTSILKPNKKNLKIFHPFDVWGQVISKEKVDTKTLDSISEIEEIDFLKIDIQGSELSVFQHGQKKLANTVVIHTEVSFISLYEDQPTFADVDIELRKLGFIPHTFFESKNWIISPLVINNDSRIPLNQIIEADIVYVKDFTKPENISNEQLKFLALISHSCYKSFDLSMRCISILEERLCLPSGSVLRYSAILDKK